MKKIFCMIISLVVMITLTSCGGTNYPGNVKPKYWLSTDNTMMFYFPAEAGRGNSEGRYLAEEGIIEDLIFEFDTKTGVVQVKTSGYVNVFSANTVTDENNLKCTFEVISQEDGYSFPETIIFNWTKEIKFFECLNNIHQWQAVHSDIIEGTLKEETLYRCTVCNRNKYEITKNPTIDEYVTFTEMNIPYDYFNQYDLVEETRENIDFIRSYNMIGNQKKYDFEYGYLNNWYKDGDLYIRNSILENTRLINDKILQVKEFHNSEHNNFQFEQIIDGNGFFLNQNPQIDDALYVGKFTTDAEGSFTFFMGQRPSDILSLPTSEVKYEYRVYPNIEIVKISGKYNDSENRIELFNVAFDITYLIKDNTIIAYLFNEIASNDDNTEYTEITEYCIPFTGELKLLPQDLIDELLAISSSINWF